MVEVVLNGSALYDTGDLSLTFTHNTLGHTVEAKGMLVGEDIYFPMSMVSFPGVGEYTAMLWVTGTCSLYERLSFTVYPTMTLLSPLQPSVINRREHGGVRTFSDMLVSDKHYCHYSIDTCLYYIMLYVYTVYVCVTQVSIEDNVDNADEVNLPEHIIVCIYAYPTLTDASTCVSNNNFLTLPGQLTPVGAVDVGSKEVQQRGVYRLTYTLDFTDTASAQWFREDNSLYIRIFISYSGYDYVTHQNYDPSNLILTHSTTIDHISPAALLELPSVLIADIILDVASPIPPPPPSQAVTVVVRGLPDLSELSEDEYKLQVIYHSYLTKEAAASEIICDVARDCVVYMERGLAEVHLTPPASSAFLTPVPHPTVTTDPTESEAIIVGTGEVGEGSSGLDSPQAMQVFVELRVVHCKLVPDAITPLDDTEAVTNDTAALQQPEDFISDQPPVVAPTGSIEVPIQVAIEVEKGNEEHAIVSDVVSDLVVKEATVAIRAPEYEILQVIPLHNNAFPFIIYKPHTLSLSPLVARVTGGSVIILTGLRYLPATMTLALLSVEDGRVLQTCGEWQDEDEYQRSVVLEEEAAEEARRALDGLNLAPNSDHMGGDDSNIVHEIIVPAEAYTSDEFLAEPVIAPEVLHSNGPVDTAIHAVERQDAEEDVIILDTIQQPLQESPIAATTTDNNTRELIDFTNEYKLRFTIPSLLPLSNTTSDEPHPHSDPTDTALSTLLEHGVYIAPLIDPAGVTWPLDLCPKLVLFNEISVIGPLSKGKGGAYTAAVTGLTLPSAIDTLPCTIRVCKHPPSSLSAVTSEADLAPDAPSHLTITEEDLHSVPDQGHSVFKHIDVVGTLTKHTEKSGVTIKLSFTPPSSDACTALFTLSHSLSTASAIGSQHTQGTTVATGVAGTPAVGAVGAAKSPRKSMIDKNKPGATSSSSNIHSYYIGISVDGGCSYDYSKEPVLEIK